MIIFSVSIVCSQRSFPTGIVIGTWLLIRYVLHSKISLSSTSGAFTHAHKCTNEPLPLYAYFEKNGKLLAIAAGLALNCFILELLKDSPNPPCLT